MAVSRIVTEIFSVEYTYHYYYYYYYYTTVCSRPMLLCLQSYITAQTNYVWLSRLWLRTEIRQRIGEKLQTSTFCSYLTLGYCSRNNVSRACFYSQRGSDCCMSV